MSFTCLKLHQIALAVLMLSALTQTAQADAVSRPSVRMIVPCPIASPTDINAREIAQWWSENSGKTYHVQNVPVLTASVGLSMLAASLIEAETMLFDLGDCNNAAGVE